MAIDVKIRRAAVEAVKSGLSMAAASRHFGIDKDCIRKWASNPDKYLVSDAERIAGLGKPNYSEKPNSSSGHLSGHKFTRPAPNTILFDHPIDIGVLPDTQVRPDVCTDYLACYGKFFAEKKPHVILQGGDFADMPSLSQHDLAGSKATEGQRYKEDILAVHRGMKTLMTPILEEMARTDWKPLLILTLGNHENRINRAIANTPKLDGCMGLPDLEYERWGWECYPFLVPVIINSVAFAHYFTSGVMGRPITTAQALLTKKHMSCFAFHQQGRDVKHGYRGDGKEITAGIFGSAYEHDEEYLNHQTNLHFRGGFMLYGVEDGVIDSTVAFNLKWLKEKYGQKT